MVMLLLAHFIAALGAPLLVRAVGRNAYLVLALFPASAVVWAASQTATLSAGGVEESFAWVPNLDLSVIFRLDVLSWLMTLIIGTVGALVLVYASRYFSSGTQGLERFAAFFLGFSGAMLGVVLADQTMTMYVFWELTAVFSYLLIGFHTARAPARSAARQAFLITGFGGLAMFSGFIMIAMVPGGSFRSSQLVTALQTGEIDVSSPQVIIAAVLILLGGLSKSAQVPFHFWLPGAMAAPTPVSAFLHAAAMVKAGVNLVARLTPGFTFIPGWSFLVVTIGFSTMILGAYRALRQRDLKLVLAYGTVSQLGLMLAAVGMGSAAAMAAGLVILLSHALFKSSLFLTVGAVETVTGTRDLWELSGLRRKTPLLALFAGLAALSMAAVPITAGYLGKEGLITALYGGSEAPWLQGSQVGDVILLIVLTIGSMMTFAYSWRVWWGAFGTKPISVEMTVKPLSPLMLTPIGLLAAGAFFGVAARPFNTLFEDAAAGLPGEPHLALWSGVGPALITAAIIVGGVALIYFHPTVARLQSAVSPSISAIKVYSWSLRELEVLASRITGLVQRGSLPAELGTIFVSLIVLVGSAIWFAPAPTRLPQIWDSPLQAGVILVGILAVVITIRARKRMKAALALGAVGMTVSLLFAVQGAPDLALTQLAVEAVSIVVFILVLRKLPTYFSARPVAISRYVKMTIGTLVGVLASVGGYYAISARIHEPASALMPEEALKFGYGRNIVNVILVDIRAWDTLGELSVLLVTATGVASLIYILTRTGRIDRVDRSELKSKGGGRFLLGVTALKPQERSMVLEVSTRLLFPTMLVFSIWLLLVGHNNPGGGFAGGVVAGLAFVLRYLAGGRYELGEAMPVPAGFLLGSGLFLAALGGGSPLLYGNEVFESTPLDVPLGALGTLHFTTSIVLDIGVYILVLGLIVDLVSALGAEVDRQGDRLTRGGRPSPGVPRRPEVPRRPSQPEGSATGTSTSRGAKNK